MKNSEEMIDEMHLMSMEMLAFLVKKEVDDALGEDRTSESVLSILRTIDEETFRESSRCLLVIMDAMGISVRHLLRENKVLRVRVTLLEEVLHGPAAAATAAQN